MAEELWSLNDFRAVNLLSNSLKTIEKVSIYKREVCNIGRASGIKWSINIITHDIWHWKIAGPTDWRNSRQGALWEFKMRAFEKQVLVVTLLFTSCRFDFTMNICIWTLQWHCFAHDKLKVLPAVHINHLLIAHGSQLLTLTLNLVDKIKE